MKKIYFWIGTVIKKPWGVEYVVYRNKKNLSVTYLRIKVYQQTSLRCHYKKKTGFIIVLVRKYNWVFMKNQNKNLLRLQN